MERGMMSKFKMLFEEQKNQLVRKQDFTTIDLKLEKDEMLDEVDMCAMEMQTSMQMRLRNRETLFMKKVDEALKRIADGSFGDCDTCGEGIEAKRLEVRPTTALCISCKEMQEHKELVHIDGHRHKSLGVKLRLA